MKRIILITLCLVSISLTAQKTNVFLDRAFWKSNPSIAIIEEKIAAGNDVAELNEHAFDAVSYALLEKVDNKTIIHLLSKEGNSVNKLTHDARTYVFWAAYKDNLEMMQYLVEQGAKTNIIDSHGYSVLNFAATTGQKNIKLYNYLFDTMKASIEEQNHDGANALLLVTPYVNDFTLVDYLITKGASIKDTDKNGNGLFNYAAKGGNTNFLNLLIEKGILPDNNAIIFASQGVRGKKNTLETYQFLEKKGVNVGAIDKSSGRNALHSIAYHTKDLAVFKYFIDKGVDVNLQDNGGDTPFMNAANSNTLAVVKYLSTYVTNLNIKDENGRSALAMAVNRNTPDVIRFLLEKGADINTVDKDGNTLSYYVLNNFKSNNPKRFEEKLQLLQENGLLVNKVQSNGNTLLHLATKKHNLDLLQRLASFKIDVNAKNESGLTALQIAAMQSKDTKIIKYLLSIGADKTITTDFDETIYDLAVENELLQNNTIEFLK